MKVDDLPTLAHGNLQLALLGEEEGCLDVECAGDLRCSIVPSVIGARAADQLVGKCQVLFVCAFAHMILLDVREAVGNALLPFLGQETISPALAA